MKDSSNILTIIISYFFVILFLYASFSKLMDFENFQIQIAQSPLLSAFASYIPLIVILLEVLISVTLLIKKSRLIGLYASYSLMILFTVYIYLLLNYSDYVPCSCGGIFEKLSWRQHLVFNVICVILAGIAIIMIKKDSNKYISKKKIFALGLSFIISTSLMTALFLSSEHIIKKENNFTRRFLPHPISDEEVLDLKVSSFYFAGNRGDSIFLGNLEAPLLMATITSDFKLLQLDTLRLSDEKLPFKKVELKTEYPNFTLSDGTVPVIFEGNLNNLTALKKEIKTPFFNQFIKISKNDYIFKSILAKEKKSVLGYLNTDNQNLKIDNKILEKQIDGIFDTDGYLVFDKLNHQIIYTYLYRNEYLVLDSLLNSKTFGKTIDTTTIARIKIHQFPDGSKKFAAPPLEVNSFQAAYGSLLFNASALRGKYESTNRWKNSKIIDVYNYNKKSYQYSFYIKDRNNRRVRSILVTKKYLYALIGNDLVRYQRRK